MIDLPLKTRIDRIVEKGVTQERFVESIWHTIFVSVVVMFIMFMAIGTSYYIGAVI